MLKGKTIVIGVTGSIAAYKAAYLASAVKKQGADVHVIMTENAAEFISPMTFETLTNNRCVVDMFDRSFDFDVEHISLAGAADLIVVAPATANFIAKAANGIADDMLSTVVLAAKCPKLIAPAMNTAMYENEVTQDNMRKLMGIELCDEAAALDNGQMELLTGDCAGNASRLKHYGWKLIEPTAGRLACGDEGKGRMEEPDVILKHILNEVAFTKDMLGLKVLVTAGPTQEPIDPVRYITNHSSGKMGYAVAEVCALRGADVTLVSGRTGLDCPAGVERIDVLSAADMHRAVLAAAPHADMIFKAAAVADYTPVTTADHKLKKTDGDMKIDLKRTADILKDVSEIRSDSQLVCGFAMETENLIENSGEKLKKKKLDMICANSLRSDGAGFGGDTNIVTIITQDRVIELERLSKFDTALRIVDEALEIRNSRIRNA